LTKTSLNEIQAHTKVGFEQCINDQGKCQAIETIFNVGNYVEVKINASENGSSGAIYMSFGPLPFIPIMVHEGTKKLSLKILYV